MHASLRARHSSALSGTWTYPFPLLCPIFLFGGGGVEKQSITPISQITSSPFCGILWGTSLSERWSEAIFLPWMVNQSMCPIQWTCQAYIFGWGYSWFVGERKYYKHVSALNLWVCWSFLRRAQYVWFGFDFDNLVDKLFIDCTIPCCTILSINMLIFKNIKLPTTTGNRTCTSWPLKILPSIQWIIGSYALNCYSRGWENI